MPSAADVNTRILEGQMLKANAETSRVLSNMPKFIEATVQKSLAPLVKRIEVLEARLAESEARLNAPNQETNQL